MHGDVSLRGRSHSGAFVFVTAVSGARLLFSPVFLFLLVWHNTLAHQWSVIVLLVLLGSDVLDGWLARRWKVTSEFGYVLDGVADRASHFAMLIGLCALNIVQPLCAFFLILRDLLLYAARTLFPEWRRTAAMFRTSARAFAVTFKIAIGLGLLVAYNDTFHFLSLTSEQRLAIVSVANVSLALMALWGYVLWYRQVAAAAVTTP